MYRWMLLGLFVLAGAAWAADEEETGPVAVGEKAPDFRLNDQDGRALRLSDHGKGRWKVLAFFPKANTPG